MELIEVVSERMKALLEAYDYSQYMLFLKSGVPRSTISMIRDFFDYELFDFQFVADNAG